MPKVPKDIRSTGRKRARKVLLKSGRKYLCEYCHGDSISYTRAAKENKEPVLQANHINKNLLDCDLANLAWACASCHAIEDRKTPKGISGKENEHGYEKWWE